MVLLEYCLISAMYMVLVGVIMIEPESVESVETVKSGIVLPVPSRMDHELPSKVVV